MKGITSWRRAGRREVEKGAPDGAKHRSAKDTKRWCKGVVGREHVWVIETWKKTAHLDAGLKVEICERCRKERKLMRDPG